MEENMKIKCEISIEITCPNCQHKDPLHYTPSDKKEFRCYECNTTYKIIAIDIDKEEVKLEQIKKLKDVVPHEFHMEYMESEAAKYLEEEVEREYFAYANQSPFKHKYIYVWWKLANGYLIGWNENPSRGWSFPVIKQVGK